MSSLLLTMTLSLSTLCRALRGDHSMSGDSQQLSLSLAAGQVPQVWRRCSSASLRPLPLWLSSLQDRITQLCHWKQTPLEPPTVTWLGGLFNPHAFLAAIKQVKARSRGRFDLSSLRIVTEVTKKLDADEVSAPCRDGVFISGMSLEGATWSSKLERIEKAGPRELACIMPIICVRAEVAPEERGGPEVYMCPVYETQARGSAALIFHATLKTRAPPSTWIMAGAALLADRSADSL
jgi:dynein heavy chain